ncbi:GNAT family N-acetyltransferase [Agaribacter flavus]|uniref:GNAT family N-acetyltransferase n=1 Tax=Agaribacter flavus TaxID=1902781 RepID=A0ABV7FLS2_9ALTE
MSSSVFQANLQLLSQLKSWLQSRQKKQIHRSILLLNANSSGINAAIEAIASNAQSLLLISNKPTDTPYKTLSQSKINSVLGSQYSHLVFDARKGFSASALFASAGLVDKCGCFIILCPRLKQWPVLDVKHNRLLSYQCNASYSYFVAHLLSELQRSPCVSHLSPRLTQLKTPQSVDNDSSFPFNNNLQQLQLSTEQSLIYEDITQSLARNQSGKFVILGKRGRGKSTLLAQIAAYALNRGMRIGYTSDKRQQCQVISRSIENYCSPIAEYLPPDIAADEEYNVDKDILFIDELASISPELITKIVAKYAFVVMAGTYDGYEGTGQGLLTRLLPSIAQIQQYELRQAFRWYDNDPIEELFEKIFTPKVDEPSFDQITARNDVNSELTIKAISKQALISNKHLYHEVVNILLKAHYQTTPNDIQRLLDDPSYHLVCAMRKVQDEQSVIGVVIYVNEGNFAQNALAEDIALGRRRVQGHLFAQNMALYTHCHDFLEYSYIRIQRVAVLDKYRLMGIGSQLLAYTQRLANENNDVLCTNFGFTDELFKFWRKNAFLLVKAGEKIDSASGTISGFFVSSKSTSNKYKLSEFLHNQLSITLPYLCAFKPKIWRRLPQRLKNTAHSSNEVNHTIVLQNIARFVAGDILPQHILAECYYIAQKTQNTTILSLIEDLNTTGMAKQDRQVLEIRLQNEIKKTR